MNSIFKFLYFNKNERIALFVFLCILVSFTVGFRLFNKPDVKLNYEFENYPSNWVDTISDEQNTVVTKVYKTENREKYIPTKVVFPLIVNINLADSLEFKQLKGIGKVFSSRIVRYRNWLGGFYATEQLLEVYGIDSVLFERIKPNLLVSDADVKKININTCDQKDLSSHPYISYKAASSIVKYREHHGDYKSLNDLKRIPLIDDELLRKIALYLELN
jgi:competence protein ComEA